MKAWRESATLILAARHGQKPNPSLSGPNYDYHLLSLKRHQNSSFMPGSYVFPGGMIEPADSDLKWQQLFGKFGFNKNSFDSLKANANIRPPIFQRTSENELPREVSLRISAIRETFEESGILLCKKSLTEGNDSNWAQHMTISESEIEHWQNKVHNDATKFYELCEGLQCYPDLWSLHEWSDWLTPTSMKFKRFETIFFLVCCQTMPYSKLECTEMENLVKKFQWETPTNFLSSSFEGYLAPPQRYELSRVARHKNVNDLLEFAVARRKIGIQLFLPVTVILSNGIANVLPGDSFYPKELHMTQRQVIDKSELTLEQFRSVSDVLNRVEFYDGAMNKVIVHNLDSTNLDGHLAPLNTDSLKSML